MNHNKRYTSFLPGRIIHLPEQAYLYFSGTSYLGMGLQAAFRQALTEGFEKFGTIYSASRNNNIQLDIYDEVESYLADVNSASGAITVSSGLLAGQLVVKLFEGSKFFYCPGVHPALWLQKQIDFESSDAEDFSKRINDAISGNEGKYIICANTIDPLRCRTSSFEWMETLPAGRDITVVLDDSHAMGLITYDHAYIGSYHGKGSYDYFKAILPEDIKLIVISSLAKATGIPGGVIFADDQTIGMIRSMPLFNGASPIVPAYLYAFLNSKSTYDWAYKKLMHNVNLFLKQNGAILDHFNYLNRYPVFYTPNNALFSYLLEENIMISSFSYPNPAAPPVTRIVLSALHTDDDISTLSVALQNYF